MKYSAPFYLIRSDIMLIHEFFANKTVATYYGQVSFNEKGENDELPVEHQKELAKIDGYTFVDNAPKKATPKKPASKAKDKEDKE
ncbi:hypothetical protein MCCARTNEY_68 [Bacillus phage vB_BanH_McCartney]|nr:hypothetical protein MCCARTNEY_68 [Bacillus phage vB_BanH_McCartney]